MLVIVILFLMLSVFAVCLAFIVTLQDDIAVHKARMDTYYVAEVSQAFRMRLTRTGALGTVTLASIQGTDEGFTTRGANPNRIYLAAATNISDGVWQFDRALVYALDDSRDPTWDPLLAASNDCSATQGFAVSPSWCFTGQGVAYDLIETRENYLQLLTEEAMRMQLTLQKLARGYGAGVADSFPAGTTPVGGARQICTAGGGACVAATCSGQVMLNQTPLDCADQFSRWGVPVVLNLPTAQHVALVSTAQNVRRANGTLRRVARELRVK